MSLYVKKRGERISNLSSNYFLNNAFIEYYHYYYDYCYSHKDDEQCEQCETLSSSKEREREREALFVLAI